MKRFFLSLLLLSPFLITTLSAQEYFTIKEYDVAIRVNKDAALDVDETIQVHFTEPRHGIYRFIPFRYPIQTLPSGTEKAQRQLESGGYSHILVENIKVDGWEYTVSTDGDYKSIKIGSADKLVDGDQQYVIHYRVLNAVNFFSDHSELYYNVIGDRWDTSIDSVNFLITLYDALPVLPSSFVATGSFGSTENNTVSGWQHNQVFSGHTTSPLGNNQGMTVGIVLPADYLVQQNYNLLGIWWLVLPVAVLVIMFLVWYKWGRDEKPTIQTEFYPPENANPGISGYIIDDTLNRRDLTALVPYWGAGGYLQVKETEKSSLFGLMKNNEYTFIKLKDLPADAMQFEKTLFNGIFATGDTVKLSDLKDVLYKTMAEAKTQLKKEIDKNDYYLKRSGMLGCVSVFFSIAFIVYGGGVVMGIWEGYLWYGIAFLASGLIILLFGIFMRKKSKKGTVLYQKLLGFKEFIKSVEQDRLAVFLKEDEHYFDKVLPYAIVFGVADTWKDKLKGLDVPPPHWYVGNYSTFNTMVFMNSLDHSMNEMSRAFYSAPSSSGSSGGSFGGGGFSGGGFGGGGGSSW